MRISDWSSDVCSSDLPHLAHPALSELYPLFAADGGESAAPMFNQAAHEMFGRVRYGAGIAQLPDHRPTLTNPHSAPFGFYGVTRRANLRAALRHEVFNVGHDGRPPALCLLVIGRGASRERGGQSG